MNIPANDELRLMCGELTADECRLVRSVWPVAYKAGLEAAAKVADNEAQEWADLAETNSKQTGHFGVVAGVLHASAANRAAGARDVAEAIRKLPARIYEGEDGA